MKGFSVNYEKFLSTISHELYYSTAQYVSKPVSFVYKVCVDKLLGVYKTGVFDTTKIHCNNESPKVMDQFLTRQYPPIKINYAAAQEHVTQSELKTRVIQERVQSAHNIFPFTYRPRILLKYLVMESTKKLNFPPNKNGVLKYFSPRMIMHQNKIHYECE